MSTTIERLAMAAAASVDQHEVEELDPILITTIFTTVIQGIIECRKSKNPGAANVFDDVQESYDTSPQWSENQVRHRIIHTARRNHDARLRPRQSRELASKLVQRGLETSRAEMAMAYEESA